MGLLHVFFPTFTLDDNAKEQLACYVFLLEANLASLSWGKTGFKMDESGWMARSQTGRKKSMNERTG